jgi:hypothetical protein
MAALTRHEERYVERSMSEFKACADQACRDSVALAIAGVINSRRKLNAEHIGPVLFDALRAPCEALGGHAVQQLECFDGLRGLTFEAAMAKAGFKREGLTMIGYYSLRTGMREKEITFILGVEPVSISRSSYGGYGAEILRYSVGRRQILVTLTDDEMSAKAQSGVG